MGAFSTWAERIDLGLRLMVPYSLLFLLLIFNVIALPILPSTTMKLPLILMGVYYWAIYRPTLISVWLAFLAGAALDFMMGVPLGLNALVLVVVRWFVVDQRRFLFAQSFIIIWLGFLLISLAAAVLQWLSFGLVNGTWVTLDSQFWTLLVSNGIFPFIYGLLHLSHKALPFPAVNSPYALKRQSRYKRVKR